MEYKQNRGIARHRLSLLDLSSPQQVYADSQKVKLKTRRNSSDWIERRMAMNENKYNQGTPMTLSFTKNKSKRSIRLKDDKENKESAHQIEDGNLPKLSFSLIPKLVTKNRLEREERKEDRSLRNSDGLLMGYLEKEMERLLEEVVVKEKTAVSRDSFEFIQKLGSGAESEVFLVMEKLTCSLFALKVIKKHKMTKSEDILRLASQLKIQLFCNHPNIVKLYGIFHDSHSIYLIQEYAGHSSLFSFIKRRHPKKSSPLISNIISQLTNAVGYLHQNCIIHRDIKPENVLVGIGGMIKLTDFGWSVHNPEKHMRNTFCGTPMYFSPELISAQSYDQSVDIWAIGVLTYEMLTGQNPFGIKCLEDLQKIVNEEIKLESISDEEAGDFVSGLLRKDRVLRTSIEDVASHVFLEKGKGFILQL